MASKKETASTTPESEVRLTQAESEMISPQTEAETLPEPVLSAEESPAVQDPGVVPQTDLGQDDIAGMAPEDGVKDEPAPPAAQTDTENAESEKNSSRPARRTRKTKAKATEADTPIAEAEGSAREEMKTPTKNRAVRPKRQIVAIDEHLAIETEAEKAQSDLLDLMESYKSKRILTGTIQGVEHPENNPALSLAVIYHGDFKVIIPAEEAVEPPEDFRGKLPEDVLHYMLTKRLGAEVDYIVKGIDAKSGIAAASRLEAMAAKRKIYYYGTDRDGNNLLYEGSCAEARIVSVIRAGIFVDLFGLEVYIPLRELSYQRMLDAQTAFQPGQRILVKILTLDRSDRYSIKVTASIKQAGENPYEKALRRYSVGNRYVGTVSIVDVNGVFVSLDGGIDCLCSYPKRGRPPRGARVTVRVLGINHDTNRIWGAITHIAMPG